MKKVLDRVLVHLAKLPAVHSDPFEHRAGDDAKLPQRELFVHAPFASGKLEEVSTSV
ncbi:MAG: hypothetical protein ABIP90_07465 [Vicinamibacterales bacterium]